MYYSVYFSFFGSFSFSLIEICFSGYFNLECSPTGESSCVKYILSSSTHGLTLFFFLFVCVLRHVCICVFAVNVIIMYNHHHIIYFASFALTKRGTESVREKTTYTRLATVKQQYLFCIIALYCNFLFSIIISFLVDSQFER